MRSVRSCETPYPEDERALLAFKKHGKQRRKLEAAQSDHERKARESSRILSHHFLTQWPKREPDLSGIEHLELFDIKTGISIVKPEWERLVDNFELSEYVKAVQRELNQCHASKPIPTPWTAEDEQSFHSISNPSLRRIAVKNLVEDGTALVEHRNIHSLSAVIDEQTIIRPRMQRQGENSASMHSSSNVLSQGKELLSALLRTAMTQYEKLTG